MRLALLLVLAACSTGVRHDDAPMISPPPPPPAADPPRALPKVVLATPKGEVTVGVEVVATEARIQRGLMYRQHLPPDEGMLFMMPGEHALERDGWPFWMHNTLVPLDIIWIDRDLVVVEIVEHARVRDDTEVGGHVPSRYVLEVNAGFAAAHGIAKGAKVRFDGVH